MNQTRTQVLISALPVRRLLGLACESGLDGEALRAHLGVDADVLATQDGVVPFTTLLHTYATISTRLADPALGVRFAAGCPCRDVGVLGYVIAHAADLEHACREVAVLHEEMRSGSDLRVELEPELRVSLPADPRAGYEGYAQGSLGIFLRCARMASGVDIQARRVELARPVDAHADVLRAAWRDFAGIEPEFGARRWAITFDPVDARRPFPAHDDALLEHLRIAAAAAAARRRAAVGGVPDRLRLAGCEVDLSRAEVRHRSGRIKLTTKETQILRHLAANPNEVVSQGELEEAVWRLDPTKVLTRAPAVAIRRLRQKIEDDPTAPKNLVTVFGEGWKLVVPLDPLDPIDPLDGPADGAVAGPPGQ